MIVELKMPKSNSKKEPNEKNKSQEQREGRRGGFLELLKNIIKILFNSVVDLPEHKQHNKMKSTNLQQGLDTKGKGPENLHPKAKLEVKEAAKGLKEELQNSDAGNQSIEIKVPNQTTTKDIDNSKTMER
ncbi:hypothetical protein [Wolbachia endosymbiont of Drosophila tsacasi]|uniref:hypothetical protein n=1 Tax=Wolbachia endosymbiont of Drosophila tsacasi TaxID=3002579 RepID=UPI0023A9252F|nr:hypothetical protein [Wolbachia endosymbiont of Drosophila tsacasi]MDE5062658.1 hypothetical protein [Wolbachia endosymbiont of Drosophila tsacasi]